MDSLYRTVAIMHQSIWRHIPVNWHRHQLHCSCLSVCAVVTETSGMSGATPPFHVYSKPLTLLPVSPRAS
jgi:hypothetical protein